MVLLTQRALGQWEALRNLNGFVIPDNTKLLLSNIHSCSLKYILVVSPF